MTADRIKGMVTRRYEIDLYGYAPPSPPAPSITRSVHSKKIHIWIICKFPILSLDRQKNTLAKKTPALFFRIATEGDDIHVGMWGCGDCGDIKVFFSLSYLYFINSFILPHVPHPHKWISIA